MSDDDIVQQRFSGRSVRTIAEARRSACPRFNAAIDRWASYTLALELARLDELQETF